MQVILFAEIVLIGVKKKDVTKCIIPTKKAKFSDAWSVDIGGVKHTRKNMSV